MNLLLWNANKCLFLLSLFQTMYVYFWIGNSSNICHYIVHLIITLYFRLINRIITLFQHSYKCKKNSTNGIEAIKLNFDITPYDFKKSQFNLILYILINLIFENHRMHSNTAMSFNSSSKMKTFSMHKHWPTTVWWIFTYSISNFRTNLAVNVKTLEKENTMFSEYLN